jgi:hypothetical protein
VVEDLCRQSRVDVEALRPRERRRGGRGRLHRESLRSGLSGQADAFPHPTDVTEERLRINAHAPPIRNVALLGYVVVVCVVPLPPRWSVVWQ